MTIIIRLHIAFQQWIIVASVQPSIAGNSNPTCLVQDSFRDRKYPWNTSYNFFLVLGISKIQMGNPDHDIKIDIDLEIDIDSDIELTMDADPGY